MREAGNTAMETQGMSRLAELGDFLRSRRARLDPAGFGFELQRRRTPGLRREEVAQLAGVSASWYTWLEQGRDIYVSEPALERLSKVLRLDAPEREHLFLLAHDRPPPQNGTAAPVIGPGLLHMLDALQPTPSYLRTTRLDILHWNDAAARTFVDYGRLEPHERNSMRLLFLYPRYRTLICNWEEIARRTVATFRANQARATEPARFQELIDELLAADHDFRAMWKDRAVRPFGEGRKTIDHPELGCRELEHVSLIVEGQPELCLVSFIDTGPGVPPEKSRRPRTNLGV